MESVWDYPRPPCVEASERHVRVVFHGVTLADSRRPYRVLETSHPPVYYVPLDDVAGEYLEPAALTTWCEWKGHAGYYDVVVGGHRAERAAWFYASPARAFEVIRDAVAFYPGRVEACFLDGERVEPQPGGFYGGWITSEVQGPFKGAPGTDGR
jgi:uncharacterized protein (DUF427 family)